MITENVYGLPGLGYTAVQAITNQDLPVIIGVVIVASAAVVVANIVVDVVYAALDPRSGSIDRGSRPASRARGLEIVTTKSPSRDGDAWLRTDDRGKARKVFTHRCRTFLTKELQA